MTKRASSLYWREELYNTVCDAKGGIRDAAAYLTEQRGTSIHMESLRRKLTGGEQLDLDACFVLADHLQGLTHSSHRALDWLMVAALQRGLHFIELPPEPEGGFEDEFGAIIQKITQGMEELGKLAGVANQATADRFLTDEEIGSIVGQSNLLCTLLQRLNRNVLRVGKKQRGEA
nr:hypothetical protein [Alcaligenes faecalis]